MIRGETLGGKASWLAGSRVSEAGYQVDCQCIGIPSSPALPEAGYLSPVPHRRVLGFTASTSLAQVPRSQGVPAKGLVRALPPCYIERSAPILSYPCTPSKSLSAAAPTVSVLPLGLHGGPCSWLAAVPNSRIVPYWVTAHARARQGNAARHVYIVQAIASNQKVCTLGEPASQGLGITPQARLPGSGRSISSGRKMR